MINDSSSKPATADQAAQLQAGVEKPASEVKALRAHRNLGVQLVCGALITFAIVVCLFIGKSVRNLEVEVVSLCTEVRKLKTTIDSQAVELHRLRDQLPPTAKAGEPADGVPAAFASPNAIYPRIQYS
ncbi:MAG: hypothetical protein ACRCZF_18435, partial [Gemmataceae bacterium]